ncbi:uncharacterized protein LOC62_04G005474 [Vanrija pseudolonga]|uniref:RING-type domain-containing protein n=1 Tax=Vanrija pseudolonga TaxID=143232 RepID=A0AAF0YEC6_9TREE|nr:hypothetical protein LOC62_04G005474 [Vanrija pseudolonga]
MASLNLRSLGVELDSVRRARARSASDAAASPDGLALPAPPAIETDEDDEEASTSSEVPESPLTSPETRTRPLPAASSKRVAEPEGEAQPLPLCLLCFSRPPSAVLLPCAHLNLCYLCAPLLMHKKAKAECFRDAALPAGQAEPPNPRAGYAAALSRAVGSSPKARRLSMGGYVAPREGMRGGEMRGRDLLSAVDGPAAAGSGIAAATDADGRVRLRLEGCGAGAQCLVCRADVSGWLRVYTG